MFEMETPLGYISSTMVVYGINFILIVAVIFFERKTSTATLAWIMVLAFVPVLGFILYLIFNQNLTRIKINKLYDNEESVIRGYLDYQIKELEEGKLRLDNYSAYKWRDLVILNQVYGNAIYSETNDIELIVDGNELFDRMLEDIRNAETSVNAEYFIIKNDKTAKRFIAALTEKAREGVEVRLLVDSLGSRGLNNLVLREYIKAGGKVAYFFPPRLARMGIKIGLNLNYRNHRKILVVDNKIGYTGGYNIGNEYCDLAPKFGHWRDSHVRIRGTGVNELNTRFILDWRFVTKEKLDLLDAGRINTEVAGDMGLQIVSCGPEAPKQEIKRGFMKMITAATDSVYIQSPYFVPDASIIESCKMASQSGVKVNIMIPNKPDHIFVYWATLSNVGELLKDGCRVFIYDGGFLHAKAIFADGEVTSIGSCNFDIRSFKLNFETNAFIFDKEFTEQMVKSFEEDMKNSRELTMEDYNKRPIFVRFKESISRLLTEIL